ncbi:HIT family protein [Clavibacter michiganensis]|uniref:HIT family protein n=1 Tax=Clavibacter michiganensis TaxID=28447 RepID=UPI0005BDABB1|nr:HIT family protein [Clavibacter michiganensis]
MSEAGTCPFCALLAGAPMAAPLPADVVAERERAVAFIAPRWWPRNRGHALVVPRAHVADLYGVERADHHAVADLVQEVAVAMRATYGCSGISTRQHNEPDGGQDVFHMHVHVFPRFADDDLYGSEPLPGFATPEERRPFAQLLRGALSG